MRREPRRHSLGDRRHEPSWSVRPRGPEGKTLVECILRRKPDQNGPVEKSRDPPGHASESSMTPPSHHSTHSKDRGSVLPASPDPLAFGGDRPGVFRSEGLCRIGQRLVLLRHSQGLSCGVPSIGLPCGGLRFKKSISCLDLASSRPDPHDAHIANLRSWKEIQSVTRTRAISTKIPLQEYDYILNQGPAPSRLRTQDTVCLPAIGPRHAIPIGKKIAGSRVAIPNLVRWKKRRESGIVPPFSLDFRPFGLEPPNFPVRKPESLGGIGFPFVLTDEVIGERIGTRLTGNYRGSEVLRSGIPGVARRQEKGVAGAHAPRVQHS